MVNFIKHFCRAMAILAEDERCTAYHGSLYFSLFFCWNRYMFRNPLSISRDELMKLSHIGSINTYHKCLRQLDEWGYIRYIPSRNMAVFSKVYMVPFDTPDAGQNIKSDTSDDDTPIKSDTSRDSARIKSDTTVDTSRGIDVRPYINLINHTNQLNTNAYEQARDSDLHYDDTAAAADTESTGTTKAERRRKPGAVPDSIEEVAAYFEEKNSTRAEAEKFYDYFESNGWRIGGRAPMKNWRAAARGWITNIPNYNNGKNSKPQPFKPQLTGPKNYAEPF